MIIIKNSIVKRWAFSVVSIIVVVIIAIGIVIGIILKKQYYDAVSLALNSRASVMVLSSFNTSSAVTDEGFNRSARRFVNNFSDKNIMEVWVIDKEGGVVVSSTGFSVEGEKFPDYDYAKTDSQGKGEWIGKMQSGEKVMALTCMLPENDYGVTGAVRYVISLEDVDNQLVRIYIFIAFLVVVFILLVIFSGAFFINSIIKPVRNITESAKQISKGDFNVSIEKHKYNDEIGQLGETINNMAREIGETERLKNEFISTVSHELRTPLTAIKGWGETIRYAPKDDTEIIDKGINVIVNESERLTSLVEELLDFSRMEGGKLTLKIDLIDITKDVTANLCEFEKKAPAAPEKVSRFTEEEMKKAIELIENAKKPFICVGGGAVASEAYEEVRAFAKKIQAPVCDTLMAKGVFDGYDDLYTGMIGMHGTKTSNFGVSQCDLLIALGARFSDRVVGNPKKFASEAKILHIDIDAAEIDKNIKTDADLVGDLKEVLTILNSRLEKQDHTEWVNHIKELKEKYPLRYDETALSCPYIMEQIDKVTEGKAIITTDVGQHQMWAAQFYHYTKPRTFLSSGGSGTMGYGLGACIGAKMGQPDKICINIGGDGCFRMNMNELATASRYNIPIIQVIINNHVLGMVRQWQTLFYDKRYSQTVLNDKVDFCKVAEGLGCEAILVTKKEEVAPAIERAISLLGGDNIITSDNNESNMLIDVDPQKIQIIYLHGKYNNYKCKNLIDEINKRDNSEFSMDK